jgi:hypothetical protein
MALDSRSVWNFLKLSEERQGYKLYFQKLKFCLQQMLHTCFVFVPFADLGSPARKDDGLLGVFTLWLQQGTLPLIL